MFEQIEIGLSASPAALGVPHLDQWGGVWAMQEDHYRMMATAIRGMNLAEHVRAQQDALAKTKQADAKQAIEQPPYQVHAGSTAVIELKGTITKYGSSFSSSGSTVRMRKAMRAAAADPTITNIVLWIESPGGSSRGVKEAADDVAAVNKLKPVTAYIEDIGCSAAYFIASQASRIVANESAFVGSIGTYMVVDDFSKWYEEKGIKTHVIRAGAFKGAGELGTEITAEQLAEWQRLVNQINEQFVTAVKKGRNFSQSKMGELADGRCHMAADAMAMGMIDGVEPIEKTLAQLSKSNPTKGAKAMSEQAQASTQTVEKKPATFTELKSGLPAASNDFICQSQEKGWDLAQATTEFMKAQQAEIDKLKAENTTAKAAAATQQSTPTGVDPSQVADKTKSKTDGSQQSGDPVGDFNARFEANLKANGGNRSDAMMKTIKDDPQAHQEYLAAYNDEHPNANQALKAQTGGK